MLHTINKSPFEKNSMETCFRLAKAGSEILFIEDGVYAVVKGSVVAPKLQQALRGDHAVYALGPDLKARGIEEDRLIEGVKVVGYDGFVDLAANNDRVQSWL